MRIPSSFCSSRARRSPHSGEKLDVVVENITHLPSRIWIKDTESAAEFRNFAKNLNATWRNFCDSLTRYSRRETVAVQIGNTAIGGDNPIRIQSMTNTDTNDTAASVAQTERIAAAGGEIARLTRRAAARPNLGAIRAELDRRGCRVPLVADIHFLPSAALVAAEHVEKIRINPGNFNDKGGQFDELLAICKDGEPRCVSASTTVRWPPAVMERCGDTPEGMVRLGDGILTPLPRAAAFDSGGAIGQIEQRPRDGAGLPDVGGGHARRGDALSAAPGRHRSGQRPRRTDQVGCGHRRAAGRRGLGDTIRVFADRSPRTRDSVARMLADYFAGRENHAPIPAVDESLYSPYSYRKRPSEKNRRYRRRRTGCDLERNPGRRPRNAVRSRYPDGRPDSRGRIVLLKTNNLNGIAEQRAALLTMAGRGLTNPVIIQRTYDESDPEVLQIKAAADLGPLFLDGFGDAIRIENLNPAILQSEIDALSLDILQTARVRISKLEYIACPSCGRTLYNIEKTLAAIKARTGHLVGVKIGVMGCIVNGPGEMADADYGYVGSGPRRITLYKGREVVRRNIPEEQAIDALLELIEKSQMER